MENSQHTCAILHPARFGNHLLPKQNICCSEHLEERILFLCNLRKSNLGMFGKVKLLKKQTDFGYSPQDSSGVKDVSGDGTFCTDALLAACISH